MTMDALPEKTRRTRDMVDAVRELLGMAPLYDEGKAEPLHCWCSHLSDSYSQWEQKQGQTPKRGSVGT